MKDGVASLSLECRLELLALDEADETVPGHQQVDGLLRSVEDRLVGGTHLVLDLFGGLVVDIYLEGHKVFFFGQESG